MKSLLLLALGLARTVVLGARIEAERIVVSVRLYKREQRRCPNARWVMDPFHVVQWMNDALDAMRCEEWNAARAARPRPKGRPSGSKARPRTREQELEERCRRLETEVAYLKKLRALVERDGL